MEFQGLLDEDKAAPYPGISAEPPGVELELEESNFQLITDDPEPNFHELAAAALDNAGINPTKRIQVARDCVLDAAAKTAGQRLVEADSTFWMPALAKTPFLPTLLHPRRRRFSWACPTMIPQHPEGKIRPDLAGV